jgi:hypothetical protein
VQTHSITLGGKDWRVQYSRRSRREIEGKLDKGLWSAIQDGKIFSQAVIVWAGIKHQERKLAVEDVVEFLESGEEFEPQVRTCLRALFESAPFGKVIAPRDIDALLGEDEERGKDQPVS